MRVNLTDYFKVRLKSDELNIPFEDKEFDGFTIKESSDLNLKISNIGDGKVTLKGKMDLLLVSPCDRCLEPVETKLSLDFEYPVTEPDGYHEYDEEDQLFMEGYELDTTALIHDELIMSLPMKVLCKEDCKGLCPVCGNNLNHKECGCDTFVPDPRLAAIQDIFNANKEV